MKWCLRLRLVVGCVGMWMLMYCTLPPQTTTPTTSCGKGYVRTSTGCVLSSSLCAPACSTDQRCVEQRCVPRFSPDSEIECAIPCDRGFVCDKNTGACVAVQGCEPACQDGFQCLEGNCVLRSVCDPPCPQLGFVCNQGLCEKTCTPACPEGERCLSGICSGQIREPQVQEPREEDVQEKTNAKEMQGEKVEEMTVESGDAGELVIEGKNEEKG